MKVPFLDLGRLHSKYFDHFMIEFRDAVLHSEFVGGESILKFEEDFAKYCGTNYCATVSSGTSAISLGLEAAGIGPGDEVILPTNTFFATAEAVNHVGATPVFCDVSEQNFNATAATVESAITSKTKAVIGVHLYGQICDVDGISKLCNDRGLIFFEDCAQAHGAIHNEKRTGNFGRAGFFSFYPGKNLGALGEGGAIVTNDTELYQQILVLRDHGQKKKYDHIKVGYNHRMHSIQGRFLRLKLRDLDEMNNKRREVASWYFHELEGINGLNVPSVKSMESHVFHIFSVFTERKAQLAEFLQSKEIGYGFHYPVLCHNQKPYTKDWATRSSQMPIAEKLASTQISLPMFPQLTRDEVNYVAKSIREFFK